MFEVLYHSLVKAEDIPELPKTMQERVRRAIEERLTTNPALYAKPLRRDLKGYRKLRVGDYRIVFSVEKSKVKILKIIHRSKVYRVAMHRNKNLI